MLRQYIAFLTLCCYASFIFAAIPINLSHQSFAALKSFLTGPTQIEEMSRQRDFKQTMHIRARETYLGYPVWGSEFIIHIPQQAALQQPAQLDGVIYTNISTDLHNTPHEIFQPEHAALAWQKSIMAGSQRQSQLVVYIDEQQQAHWAYHLRSYVPPAGTNALPAKPNFILDAVTFKIYQKWDEIKTTFAAIEGGGLGGNVKIGSIIYDGKAGHLAKFMLTRDPKLKLCLLKNADIAVYDINTNQLEAFPCEFPDKLHNNVYWSGDKDAVNGGYSPANDAMFAGTMIKRMYADWYHTPVLSNQDGTAMILNMVLHAKMDNAYWDGNMMTFGDGLDYFYPLTSLDVAAHEISHGYTEQHANLFYYGQSGGLDESFSDMAAMAAEYYVTGHNHWQIGAHITKQKGAVLRYMDQPSKDCVGAGACSIDSLDQYRNGMNVHYSSGIYNRFFYLLATAPDWNVKKAFDVMVRANAYYWTPSSNFTMAACGVIHATQDLAYAVPPVRHAFSLVGIDTNNC